MDLKKNAAPFEAAVPRLGASALAALARNETNVADAYLEQALALDPHNATLHFYAGCAREQQGDWKSAAAAYRRAAQLRPDFSLARLHLGVVFEKLDMMPAALVQYARALADAQGRGEWTDRRTTPSVLIPRIEHAVSLVRAERRRRLNEVFGALESRLGRQPLERVARGVRLYLGEEHPGRAHPAQQPTFFHMPDLPASPFLDRSVLSWVESFEQHTELICAELGVVLHSSEAAERVFSSESLEEQNLRGTLAKPSWNGFYFYRHGERRVENCRRCPGTSAALDALPLARVPGHAPEVLFSVFSPGTHLLPHRGVTNTRVVGHLPLIVPRDCALRVGGIEHPWRRGEVVVFDDTFEHEAWNRSNQTRVVLIFDLWNPHLSEPEREAVAALVAEIGALRERIEEA